jgi:hypothetical protein
MVQGYSINAIIDDKVYSFKIIPESVVEKTTDGKKVTRAMTEQDISSLFTQSDVLGVSRISNSDIQKGILALGGAQ